MNIIIYSKYIIFEKKKLFIWLIVYVDVLREKKVKWLIYLLDNLECKWLYLFMFLWYLMIFLFILFYLLYSKFVLNFVKCILGLISVYDFENFN